MPLLQVTSLRGSKLLVHVAAGWRRCDERKKSADSMLLAQSASTATSSGVSTIPAAASASGVTAAQPATGRS